MNLLAFDTATEACSVALASGGEVYEEFAVAPREHNRLLLEMCDAVLAAADLPVERLDALALGCGPGAFVGVRIAAAAAQGIAYAHGLRVVPVSDLAALAQQMFDESDAESALAVLDARMGEVYYGCFRRGANGLSEADGEERLASPEAIVESGRRFDCVGGPGLVRYPELAAAARRGEAGLLPRASALLRLAAAKFSAGEALQAPQLIPSYLREPVAASAGGKRSGAEGGKNASQRL